MGGLPFSDGEGEVVERDWEDGGRERKLIALEKLINNNKKKTGI